MALGFAKEDSRLILWDIHKENLEKVATEVKRFGAEANSFVCDVTNKELVYKLAEKIKKNIGKVDVLINNAGYVTGKKFFECDDEELKKTYDINILSHLWTTKAFLPDMMKENLGHLVTVASASGLIGVNSLAAYSSSKFAAFGFNESIRMELKTKKLSGVNTTVVCPFYIDTGMFEGAKGFPLLLPILKEKWVAQKIISAVKRNKEELIMPSLVKTIPICRIFPAFIFDRIADLLGVNRSMDEFVGRGKK